MASAVGNSHVASSAHTGQILVGTATGGALSGTPFVVEPPVPTPQPPSITGFTPGQGAAGTPVTVSGNNFTSQTTVTFNGVPAVSRVVSATQVETTVPEAARSGPIGVRTEGGTAQSASDFTVILPPPQSKVELSVSPGAQAVEAGKSTGYTVALNRTNFNAPLNLAVSGLPAGASAAFNPNPATGTSSVLTVTTATNTPTGTSTLTINGTGSGVTIAPVT